MIFMFFLNSSKLVAQFSREETSLLVLRVMVGLVILYDWVHPSGAFCRSSSVDVKGCVKFLQQQPPAKAEPLLNALRYTTRHLNHPSTPKNIRTLLSAWGQHSSLACCCLEWQQTNKTDWYSYNITYYQSLICNTSINKLYSLLFVFIVYYY